MAVPSSGQLCLLGIAREKNYDSYTSPSTPPVVSPFKGYELENLADGTQYGTINTNSPSYPDGTAPHCMSEWYGYDHDAAPPGASWRTMAATGVFVNNWVSSAGTVPAAMVSQGTQRSPTPAVTSCTQEFNGTSWSAGGANTTTRQALNISAIGTQNSGLAFGGSDGPSTRCGTSEYNGSTWANSNNVPTNIRLSGTGGTQVAAIFAGGLNPSTVATTGEYNGTTWATGPNMPTVVYANTGVGIQNDFLVTGGRCGGLNVCLTREYNGSSWSTGPNLPTGRLGASGGGTANDAKVAGGKQCAPAAPTIQSLTVVEDYNGTAWSTGTSLPDCRQNMASGGTTTCMWTIGGNKQAAPAGSPNTQCCDGYIWD